MKLILLRHGLTEANEKRLYCGSTDIGLSEKGIDELLRKKESRALPDITGFRALTSGMKRCEETLRVLYGEVAHSVDGDFREMDFGDFEMRSYGELRSDPAYLSWIDGDNEKNIAPNGESGDMMRGRVLRGLGRIMNGGRDTLLVTHGGVIAIIIAELFGSDIGNRYELQPPCGGGYIIDTEQGRYEVIA